MLQLVKDKIKTSIAEQLYAKNAELVELNYALTLIQDAENIVQSSGQNIEVVLDELVKKMIEDAEFMLFGLFLHSEDSNLYHNKFMKSNPLNPVNVETIKVNNIARLTSTTREILNINEEYQINIGEFFDSPLLFAFKDSKINIKKLPFSNGFFGFIFYCTSDSNLTSLQKQIISRLSRFIGPSFENLLLTEELQNTTKILQKTNEKLMALDEAKDEFISMASHQLRTPLTSVKGYVSMVLEGDAGAIEPMQKQLLEQAFTSSQRMVGLIADLLNVSRLKTGKFIIENKPTNLADLVESEISQLQETAKVRNLKLLYKKPKDFPVLMLDEVKVRQVAMNFLDNAIYYTPAGGKIVVELSSTDNTVTYKVIDNGIGVPKSQVHHLFNKFYRADNARKARPDGTGLGLYMAKKVIVAQGGSIVFTTTEGKGSTFGFSFPRKKLEP